MKLRGIEEVLITRGAGFVGSRTIDLLTEGGYQVAVLHNLTPRFTGGKKNSPDDINDNATFIHGDIRNRELLKETTFKIES